MIELLFLAGVALLLWQCVALYPMRVVKNARGEYTIDARELNPDE